MLCKDQNGIGRRMANAYKEISLGTADTEVLWTEYMGTETCWHTKNPVGEACGCSKAIVSAAATWNLWASYQLGDWNGRQKKCNEICTMLIKVTIVITSPLVLWMGLVSLLSTWKKLHLFSVIVHPKTHLQVPPWCWNSIVFDFRARTNCSVVEQRWDGVSFTVLSCWFQNVPIHSLVSVDPSQQEADNFRFQVLTIGKQTIP